MHRIFAAVTPDIAEVLHLLAKRYNRPEIADATGLSPSTVRNYIERIEDLTKLDQRGLRDFWADGGEQGYLARLAGRLERGTGELGR
jgi:ParB-like chromosome segregation protein Spo0J